MHCDRVGTNYGDAVRLTLREEDDDNIVRVLLPRHYSSAISEDDVAAINTQRHMYYLTYKGNSVSTGHPMLQMDVRCLPSLLQNSFFMRILDQAIDGAKEYYFTDSCLQYTTGSARWFPQFNLLTIIALGFMFDLLKFFWHHDICCYIGGSFPTYLAGLQMWFHRISFFIALKDSTLGNLIIQRGETQLDVFAFGSFHFTLYQNLQHADVFSYVV